ncbi:MAG: TRAP transporter small permease [Gammaproteobacteria bacterium]|jgi:C4-dicarboxylate transporter DctQ subunit
MSTSATVLTDNTKLSLLDRLFFKFESLLNLLGGITIFLLVLLATINVLGRWLFSMPVDGYVDWIEQAMAFIAFLGIAYTKRLGGHIRMDILVSLLKGRMLWFVEFISTMMMLMITLVLIYGSYLHFWRAFSIGDSSLDINLPTWPAKLVVPFALSVLALRLLLQLWAYARALKQGGNSAVGVPLVESPADIAAKEAASVMGNDNEVPK